jgi:hypothetical protein
MNYEKIDASEKNCILFWMEHKDGIDCQHCGRSRYVKVINEDGASFTTKVEVKQLCYIPIMPRLKRLFLCKEMVEQMRWHMEGICDSEDADIILHPMDVEASHTLNCFDPEFAGDHRSVHLHLLIDDFQPYNSNSTVYSY